MYIPHSAKFSGLVIFTFFADWHRTSKIKLREMLKYRIDALTSPLSSQIKLREMLKYRVYINEILGPRKFSRNF